MESDAAGNANAANLSPDERQALNSTILEYYKKFGRKRDLEQYFSLNTAQGDIKDVTSLFWRRMKSQDSSDSGEKSRDTSLEVCRIQIQCSAVDTDPTSSQDENPQTKSDSGSPPIITEETKPLDASRQSDDESIKSDDKSVKSDDNNSQKSVDAILDTSINKAYSPSSSITSQRKLEWDSLADVGYANESDKRTSASSLSTLERLALQQQYSNNDKHQEGHMGPPTAHSTFLDDGEMKSKNKKSSKVTKIYRKDVDCVEVNVPQNFDANIPQQSINVNLTKHISFSVDKGGEVSVDNVKKEYNISPEKKSVETNVTQQVTEDKEIQTSLIKNKDKSSSSGEIPKPIQLYGQGIPVLINLNNLKKRQRRKKVNATRKKLRIRKRLHADKENVPVLEKSGEQVSEAESFEYMPGHIYNQNQMNKEPSRSSQTAGNKSSLESSGATTTDSSKGSKHSFTKDLENSINKLKSAFNKRYDDTELKQKLIKEVVQRLLKSNYRDDESTTDFLSGLSFSSKKLGLTGGNNTTSSTSDANNTVGKAKLARPKKSILRVDKFNPNTIASTSQSAPNLPTVSCSETPISTNLAKVLTISNSSSDASSKGKNSSDTAFAKTSSEELYQKYIDALIREEAYKKHLREKEQFLKQKLVATQAVSAHTVSRNNNILTGPTTLDVKSRLKLKELMKDLTRNNYDDGSGDASKLEGGLTSGIGLRHGEGRNQRSHSVFTLSSSGNSDNSRRSNLKKSEMKDVPRAGSSKDEKHYCCCPHHLGNKMTVTDSSVQVNIRGDDETTVNNNVAMGLPCPAKTKPTQPMARIVSDDNTGEIKYLCLCNPGDEEKQIPSDNFLVYKCSRLNSKCVCLPQIAKASEFKGRNSNLDDGKPSKGSQTCIKISDCSDKKVMCIHEAVRVTQTDISINPKISDPSLSDIKITSNNDCVRLVREQFRQVSKTSIDSNSTGNTEQNAGNDVRNQPTTSNIYLRAGNMDNRPEEELRSDIDLQARQAQSKGFYGDDGDYTIPIQGTNMTLKVSVGSNPVTNMEVYDSKGLGRPIDIINSDKTMYERACCSNAVVTDGVETKENATSLIEECSKGVQSDGKHILSQFEQKPRNIDTKLTKKCAGLRQRNTSYWNLPQRKQFMRSNTFAGIEEKPYGVRDEILEEFYEKEHWSTYPLPSEQRISFERNEQYMPDLSKKKTDSCCGPSYSETNEADIENVSIDSSPRPEPIERQSISGDNDAGRKPVPVKMVDTSCDPISKNCLDPCPCPEYAACEHVCGKYAECRNQESVTLRRMEASRPQENCPCSCSDSAKCGGYCKKDAACRKQSINSNKQFQHPPTPCGCPDSAKCGGYCKKDAVCRKQQTHPIEEFKRPQTPRKTPCICPTDAKCGGFCKKDASCMKTLPPTEESNRPSSPVKSPCGCADTAKCGGYCKKDASCRKESFDSNNKYSRKSSEEYRPPVADKNPCGCSSSAKCEGLCEKDAACRKKVVEVKESGLDGDSGESPSEKEHLDFQDLKNYIKWQTYPALSKRISKPRSPSLPTDPTTSNLKQFLMSTEDESPSDEKTTSQSEKTNQDVSTMQTTDSNDLIMNVIKDVTSRYSKQNLEKSQKKKCFKEIIAILNYLLDTEDATKADAIKDLKSVVGESSSYEPNDYAQVKLAKSTSRGTITENPKEKYEPGYGKKTCDKGVQLSTKKSKSPKHYTETSDPTSSECPCTSSDSVTCKVLSKIRKECEKYHRNCSKRHPSPKRCQCSSTTKAGCDRCKQILFCKCQSSSANCDRCKRIHFCECRPQKCKGRPKSACERYKKKCVAYNLIIQTSESMISEEYNNNKCSRPLKNIVVKVPAKKPVCDVPFKEMECEIGRQCESQRSEGRTHRSRSLPNDSFSSTDDYVKGTAFTVKDYLEKNRPDFIEQCGQRQKCLKRISEARASNRAAQRELLSMQVQVEPTLRALSESDLRDLAKELGLNLRHRKEPQKLISEREMKNHSKKIYKRLPEVVQKKEELKKENIKKTNLLLANIFKKNLQKKTLRGAVNLSNYSNVIKI